MSAHVLGFLVAVAICLGLIILVYSLPPPPPPEQPCVLSGLVRDAGDGRPIPGADVTGVYADGLDGKTDSWVIRTRGDGAWSHATLCDQPYRVTVQVDGYSPSVRTLGPGSDEWVFELTRT